MKRLDSLKHSPKLLPDDGFKFSQEMRQECQTHINKIKFDASTSDEEKAGLQAMHLKSFATPACSSALAANTFVAGTVDEHILTMEHKPHVPLGVKAAQKQASGAKIDKSGHGRF